MIIYEGEKYACLNCIRGHRSSTCEHKDRPLLLVRKRGRPMSTSVVRVAIVPEDSNSNVKNSNRVNDEYSNVSFMNGNDNGNFFHDQEIGGKSNDIGIDLGYNGIEGTIPSGIRTPPISPNNCSKCGNISNSCSCRENPVIVIEPGKHHKQLVDTRDGTVKVVGSRGNENNNYIKNGNTDTKKKARLRLKMNCARRNRSSTPLGESIKQEQELEEENDKYVFVPVGNGLYRKELRSDINTLPAEENDELTDSYSQHSIQETGCPPGTSKAEYLKMLLTKLDARSKIESKSCCKSSTPDLVTTSTTNSTASAPITPITPTTVTTTSTVDLPINVPTNINNNHTYSFPRANTNQQSNHLDPPLIIAPMSFDGASFSDMGFDSSMQSFESNINVKSEPLPPNQDEELNSLQRILEMQINDNPSEESEFYDIYYTASCVIPGQCQCGDSCTCAGCPTHDPNYQKG